MIRGVRRRIGHALRADRLERRYRLVLLGAFVVCVVLRVPTTVQELPPFQFCDEAIFSDEAFRLASQHLWNTQEFRSGAFNIYPMVVVGRILGHLHLLSTTSLVIAGRWFYAVLLASATVLLVAGSARRLTGRRLAGCVGAALFVLSPTVLAVSRYWYPDHYLMLFTAALVYLLIRVLQERPSGRREVVLLALIAAVLALSLTVKYTLSLAAIPVVLAVWFSLPRSRVLHLRVRAALVRLVVLGAVTAVLTGVLELSAVLDPSGFVAGFRFNVENYARPGGGPEGIVFYAFLLVVATAGVIGVVGLVTGLARMRRDIATLATLFVFPVVNIAYLGLQGIVFNRNIVACIPFVLPVITVGVTSLLERIAADRRSARSVVIAVGLGAAVLLQVAQVGSNFVADLRPDSEPIAAAWVKTHLPPGQTVGENAACSVSPAQAAGFAVQLDPQMTAGLRYYVINSYWESALNAAYRGPAAAWAILDQKYLHYYFPSDRDLPFDVAHLPWPAVTPQEAAPAGYRVIKVFDENGPQIVVLRKR